MYAKLFCKTGLLAGASFRIEEEASIGKGTENAIQLDAPSISGTHARIYFDRSADCYCLEDRGSRNGTRLDGVRVRERERLGGLHVITFAETFDFVFQVFPENVPATPTPKTVVENDAFAAQVAARNEVKAPAENAAQPKKTIIGEEFGPMPRIPAGEKEAAREQAAPAGVEKTVFDDGALMPPSIPVDRKPSSEPDEEHQMPRGKAPSAPVVFELEFKEVKGGRSRFTLHEGENVVGRATSCDIPIEDSSMSRNHAVLTVKGGRVTIKDLGSKNHTFVGNKRLAGDTEIDPDTGITFGIVEATLRRIS